jgi:hypothetical protein
MGDAELFSPLAWPMLIEPIRPDEVMRGHDMVRRGNPASIQGETPIDFLNKVQKVAYRFDLMR